MQYLERLRHRGYLALGLMLALLLVAAVACGTAAEEQMSAPADTQPAAGQSMQPTAMPAPADPAMAMDGAVSPGRVTMMLGGFGAEVAALIADKAFMDLDAPVRRLGAPDVPMPYNDALERATIPSVEKITETIRGLAAF